MADTSQKKNLNAEELREVYRNVVKDAIRELIETKHLYQSLSLDEKWTMPQGQSTFS
ncbi:hypothetical protein SH580_05845 [Coraliomargarita algicola]|uniref:Uncharacterized protein n=1 Tax=Coraliomargarita algicola TaxID=3092156 RepID=A0ABZ0RPZ9_9BACT|nr:hypothetical protein [Coraliomargarita sp. J2-16]WPJ97228.1 hypothetical protein SH580_05845 [Coraliomargarita sp. J2-16]